MIFFIFLFGEAAPISKFFFFFGLFEYEKNKEKENLFFLLCLAKTKE